MKKLTAVILSAVLAFSVFAVSGCKEKPAETKDQLTKIKEAGKIIIAMEGVWAPWTYHDDSGELVGFDTEVAKAIAAKLGVEAEFVEAGWDALFAGLDSGRYDIVVNGVEKTEERGKQYNFTEAYAYIKTALIVRSDNEDIKTFEDLNGKKTCNSLNSTYMLLAEEYGATVQGVDSLEETLNMVLNGRVDATLNAEVSFFDYMAVYPDAPLKVVALTEEASHVVIPVRKNENTDTLREAISEAIRELREDGTLAAISIKYFGKDITK